MAYDDKYAGRGRPRKYLPGDERKNLVIGLPTSVHTRLKVAAAANRMTMSDFTWSLIDSQVDTYGAALLLKAEDDTGRE